MSDDFPIKPNDKKPKGPGGRPPKLTLFKIEKTKELIESGKNNKEVCKILGISTTTLVNWRSTSEQFLAAYNQSKANANEMVKASLFNKANGYTIEKKRVTTDDGGVRKTVIEELYFPPDTQAQQFWLKNQDPDNWKDKTEQHVTGNVAAIVAESPEQQLERVKNMLKDELK